MKNQKIIGLLFYGEADRQLFQDFLQLQGFRVKAPRPEKFKAENWVEVNLILVESSLALRFKQELLDLKQRAFSNFFFIPIIVSISKFESSAQWLSSGFDDVLMLPMDKALLDGRINFWLKLQDETAGRFRELVERSHLGFYRTTPDGRILYANPALIKMLGFSSLEELAQRNLEKEGFEPSYPRSLFKEIMEKEGQITGLEAVWLKKDGSRVWVRESAKAIRDESGKILYYEGSVEDITEKVKTEQAYLTIVENSLQGIAILQDGRVVFANPALERLSGYSRQELLSLTPAQVINMVHPEDRAMVFDRMQKRLRGEEVLSIYDFRFIHKNGETRWVRVAANRIEFQEKPAILVISLDITKEKHVTERLEAIQQLGKQLALVFSPQEIAETIITGAKNLLGLEDIGLYFLDSSEEKLVLFSHSLETPPGPERFPLEAKKGIVPFVARTGQNVYLPDVSKDRRYVPGVKKTQSEFCVPLKSREKVIGVLNVESPKLDAFSPQDQKLIEALADVASVALSRAEYFQLLMESQERFDHLAQNSPDVIYRLRFLPELRVDYISPAVKKITGYNPEDFYSDRDLWLKIIHPEDQPKVKEMLNSIELFNRPIDLRWIRKDGQIIWGEHVNVPLYDDFGHIIALDGIARDITEYKLSQEKIQENQKILLTLMDSIDDIIYVADTDTYEILFANSYTKKLFGQELVGRFCYKEFQHLDSPCSFCTNEKIKSLNYTPYYWEYYNPLTKRDYQIIDRIIRWFDGRDVRLEIARDITELKAKQKQISQYAEKVEELLHQVVNAFSSAMELRDPYTSGHQRRVAELSCALAQEMGFSEERLQGLRVAALLHDIGKGLFVPAEILNKPGPLTMWEMALVKVHPQAGYEVLKKVDFPWPVAEIVFQHHERLDGSGYPQGLKDEAILLEAKIIGVADVVEAMSSHRPYRPALGIEKALEEIESQKGCLYDPQVVEACLRVFSRGFSFPSIHEIRI